MKKVILLAGIVFISLFIILYAESSAVEKSKGSTRGLMDAFLYLFDFQIEGNANQANKSSRGNNPPNLSAGDFETLMTGQGRNTTILGSEDEFVEKVLKNGAGLSTGFSSGSYAPNLHEIYQKSVAKNVNPLIVTTIWGVEQGFSIDGFGCLPYSSYPSYESQVNCAVNTLNNGMKEFEDKKAGGEFPVGLTNDLTHRTCYYKDPFIYEYESYTPVCTQDDGNDPGRGNFVKIFKQFYGEG